MKLKNFLLPKPRPYWHVDAKWVCGILLLVLMACSLFLYSVYRLNDEQNGPTVTALLIGSLLIRGDVQQSKADARKEIAKQGGAIRPFPTFPSVVITEKDLELPPADIKLKIFKPLADSIYNEGIEGTAARFAKTPEEKQKFINDAFLFRLFTKDTHESLRSLLTVLMLVAGLLFLAVMYFSAGWGRLANPGLLLVAASLPGSFLALALLHQPENTSEGSAGFLPPDVGQQIGDALSQSYRPALLLGLVLLMTAGLGKIFTHIQKKRTTKLSASR